MFRRKTNKILSTYIAASSMLLRILLSITLILSLLIQMPIYAGAEVKLAGQESKSESEITDIPEFINSYKPIDNSNLFSNPKPNNQVVAVGLNLPDKYDSRKNGYITSVKNQGGYGTCWAHAVMSAAETSILKEGLYDGKGELDLSEMHLAYSSYNRENDPLGNTGEDKNIVLEKNWLDIGGNLLFTAMHLAQWSDPLLEDEAPYSKIPNKDNEYGPPAFKLENAMFVPKSINDIKQYIMEYGSVVISYYSNGSEFKSSAPYYSDNQSYSKVNHAVTVVGWDDTVSKDKFTGENKPWIDGVWIVKNSWGTGRGINAHDGYFNMSQAETITDAVAFDYMKSEDYDYNYFYDGSYPWNYLSANTLRAGNIYEAKNGTKYINEYIKGVSVNIESNNTDCEVQVYTNIKNDSDPTSGTPMLKTSAKLYAELPGVYTIPLGELFKIEKGTKFSVVVTLTNHSNNGSSCLFVSKSSNYTWLKTEEHTEPNQSFVYENDGWNDLHGYKGEYRCACVKALTVIDDTRTPINKEDITLEKLEYDYSGSECKPEASIVVDGKKLTESVDYEIKYNENVNVGTATAKISALNAYRGEFEIPFKINAVDFADNMIEQIENQVFMGEYLKPDVVVKFGQKTLVKNTDYTIAYQQNLNVGTANVIVYGRKNYTGSAQSTFKIVPHTLDESMVSDIDSQEYTGNVIKPNVTLMLDKKTLVSGIDYTVSYGENVNPGTGTVQITGIGNYTGSVTKEFQIVEAPHNYFTITANAQPGGSITPSGEISVEEGKDQTFNISADDGYSIEDVMVDGESIGAVSEYTFTSVKGSHTIEVTFKKDIVKVESIELSDSEVTLKEGDNYTLTAEVKPEQAENKSLSWTSEDTDVATVDNGVITALKAGSTVITVKSLDGSEVTASCKLTVIAADSGDKPSEPTTDSSENSNNTLDSSNNTSAQISNTSPTLAIPVEKANNKIILAAKDKANAEKIMKQAKITKLTAKAKGKKKIVVSWKKVKNAKGYEVQVAANKKFKKNKIIVTKNVKGKKVTIKSSKIKRKKTYYIRVRAYTTYQDANGVTQKVYSSWIKKIRKVKAK